MDNKKDNIFELQELVEAFLNIEPEPVEGIPSVVMHPIFESSAIFIEDSFVNILDGEESLEKARDTVRDTINKSHTVYKLYSIIRKSYRLTFLKYAKEYLSRKTFDELFADAWVTSENPNGDVNVSLKEAVTWFKEANKKYLMDEEEYLVYESLLKKGKVRVYRGVAVGREAKGLSWTTDKQKAIWFAHRFDRGGKVGYLESAVAKREDILAYFNSRKEREVVVNTFQLNTIKIENDKVEE